MKKGKMPVSLSFSQLFLMLLLLSGCAAGQDVFKQGSTALSEQQYDQAVLYYLEAVQEDPSNSAYRLNLQKARAMAALQHVQQGDSYLEQEQFQKALQEYGMAYDLDRSLFAAKDGMASARDLLTVANLTVEAEGLLTDNRQAQAQKLIDQALKISPDDAKALRLKTRIKQKRFALVDGIELDVISTDPISLNFNKTKLPDVFKILTQLSGINFIIDQDVRDKPTTLFIEQATFAQTLELLLRMNKLDKKILNEKTIILYPKTRDKQKQFDDQVIQTFYLSHMDAKKAVNMLRTMLQVRKVHVQEDLNAIVIRDQPDVIRLAQKLLEANDRGDAEVVFELELIEVNHSDTRELGLKLSNYTVGAGLSLPDSGTIIDSGLGAATTAGNLVPFTSDLNPFKLNGDFDAYYSLPNATFRFMKTLVDAEVLASPKIRVKNKEKAKVHVGTREPVITVTTTGENQKSDSVQYIDVGVKLDVEPQIQLDNTIITKLGLEVSNVSGRQTTSNGTAVISISSTNADTTLTLKDGEQTVIGGLIRDDKATSKNVIPILGDIPILGELFNSTDKIKTKREILLSITPHIVKSVQVPTGDAASIWSGGEDDLKFGRNFGTFAQDYLASQDELHPLDKSDIERPEKPVDSERVNGALQAAENRPATGAEGSQPLMGTGQIVEEVIEAPQPLKPQAKSMLFIDGPREVTSGESFEVRVVVERTRGLMRVPMTVRYDPATISFVKAEGGSFLPGTVRASNAKQGVINLDLSQVTPGSAASGQGVLYTLTFKADQVGEFKLSAEDVAFSDQSGARFSVDSFDMISVVKP